MHFTRIFVDPYIILSISVSSDVMTHKAHKTLSDELAMKYHVMSNFYIDKYVSISHIYIYICVHRRAAQSSVWNHLIVVNTKIPTLLKCHKTSIKNKEGRRVVSVGHAALTCTRPEPFCGVALCPPSASLDDCSARWRMDPQLNIDTLLTAARLLESNSLLASTRPLVAPLSVQPSIGNQIPSQQLYVELRDFISGKMRVERKMCSASTSTQPYCISSPSRKASSKHSRDLYIILDGLCTIVSLQFQSATMCAGAKCTDNVCRAAHNELEKTRRANLRGCLETLKTLVPPIADASRNTTLALLTRARDHIKVRVDDWFSWSARAVSHYA
uniref:BHLH domain-containing protein n=1 Tax=Heterorhabditis bacteriophora TaxID=37862 RepID=A0A1I7X8Y9_HETBA